MLSALARARRIRVPPQPWTPTPEEAAAIAAGELFVIPVPGGPTVYIDLSARHERVKQ